MASITRRTILKLSAASVGGAILSPLSPLSPLFPGALRAEDAKRADFRIAVLNDTHYNDEKCGPFFEGLVKKLNGSELDMVLLAGDLTQSGFKKQFSEFRDILGKLKPPLKTVIGNHDFANEVDPKDPNGARANVSNATYVAAFPDALNYTFDLNGWEFIALDSCDGTNWKDVNVGKTALDFLDQALAKLDKKKPAIVVTHFPLGAQDKNNYPGSRLANADDILKRIKDHNVRAIFNGHFHGITERSSGETQITTGPACSFFIPNHDGTKTKGYFQVVCKDGKVTREFVEHTPEEVAATRSG